MPVTATAVAELTVVPSPSWPMSFVPQHTTEPFARTAQEWKPPVVTAVAWVTWETTTGVEESVTVPFPS
jgi:hypothetical protein